MPRYRSFRGKRDPRNATPKGEAGKSIYRRELGQCPTCGSRWPRWPVMVWMDGKGRWHDSRGKRFAVTLSGGKWVEIDVTYMRMGTRKSAKCDHEFHQLKGVTSGKDPLATDGWPALDEERSDELAARAAEAKSRNRMRQGKDSR